MITEADGQRAFPPVIAKKNRFALPRFSFADSNWAQGEYAKAEPLLKEALDAEQKLFGRGHQYTVLSLSHLALLQFDLGQRDETKVLARSEAEMQRNLLSKMFSFSSEPQRLAYLATLNPYLLFTLLPGCETDLALAVLRYKGVVLDSIIEDRLLAQTGNEEANRDLVEELNTKKRILAQLSLQTTAASAKEASQRTQGLEQEVENLQGKLARQGTDLGQARRAMSIRLEEVQGALPIDTVLVEYVRYKHYLGESKFELRYGAVVLSADSPPRWLMLGSAEDIEASLRSYQRLARKASDLEMAAILRKIYCEVWEPVAQAFPVGANRVIISPDGQLNFLSFATLLDPENGFVAEKYSIQYVTSGRDLLRETQPTLSKQAIVMANPNFDMHIQLASSDLPSENFGVLRGMEKREIADLSFRQLEGTQKESAQLLFKFEHWGWQAKSFTGPDASKRALFNLHSPYILHLATHGFFEPEESSSEENPNGFQSPALKADLTKSKFFKNPMHCSGLALTGANSTVNAWKRGESPPIEENGILTGHLVSDLIGL